MRKIHIAAVLPVFNRVDETLECLKRLEQLNKNGVIITTILVDDGSTDGTERIISTNFPTVKILRGNGNLWWAGGVNKGLTYIKDNITKFDYILILNNDTVFTENTLAPLLSVVKNNINTVCASLVVDEESGNIYSGGVIRSGFFQELKPMLNGENPVRHKNKILKCESVGTRFVLMPCQIVNDVGLFNSKKFPHGFSDFEYFLRATINGYKVTVNTKSIISTLQNKNYLNKRIINQDLKSFLKSFFDIRYGTDLKYIFYSSFSHKPVIIGVISFIKNIVSLIKWTIFKSLLPQNTLIKIVNSKWKV